MAAPLERTRKETRHTPKHLVDIAYLLFVLAMIRRPRRGWFYRDWL